MLRLEWKQLPDLLGLSCDFLAIGTSCRGSTRLAKCLDCLGTLTYIAMLRRSVHRSEYVSVVLCSPAAFSHLRMRLEP